MLFKFSKNKLWLGLSIALTLFFLFAGASYIIKGDVRYTSDIARDFMIAEEIAQKKIVLIGPRASAMPGMFHGPLWAYLQQTAYILGNGDPRVFGYFWFLLTVSFVILMGLVVYRVFGFVSMCVALIFTSSLMVDQVYQMFNPHGALILMPLLWFLLVRYFEKKRLIYLFGVYLSLGAIIQFQMAVGVPLFIAISGLVFYQSWRDQSWRSLWTLLGVVPFILPWVIFDFRHEFSLIKSAIAYFTYKNPERVYYDLFNLLNMRVNSFFTEGWGIFTQGHTSLNILAASVLIYVISAKGTNLKDQKLMALYTASYLYLAFFILSLAHNGWLLYQYYTPIIPLTIIAFAGIFAVIKPNKLLIALLVAAILHNFQLSYKFMEDSKYRVGREKDSWLFHRRLAKKALSQDEEGGYFIYAPDFFGYQLKYAMRYQEKLNGGSNRFNKKTKTLYVVAEPIPKNVEGLSLDWWVKNKLKVKSEAIPVAIENANGYQILKYNLSKDDIKEPYDNDLDSWLYFR